MRLLCLTMGRPLPQQSERCLSCGKVAHRCICAGPAWQHGARCCRDGRCTVPGLCASWGPVGCWPSASLLSRLQSRWPEGSQPTPSLFGAARLAYRNQVSRHILSQCPSAKHLLWRVCECCAAVLATNSAAHGICASLCMHGISGAFVLCSQVQP